ncbi:phage terminase large subunit [Chitinophaga jiangningensis]|uniref:Phage terminase large subunit n=1 Tax=Chitinophaga jiangningensis TaxID=1419482 RepID=A0A1M6WHI3_9BACT|nr:phage terminase large subunit [Chitinophaga jiangningensis]SHK93148.1 phage terminase large subunit [Chitinophaga jiangningensis]
MVEHRFKFSKVYQAVFKTLARYIHIWGGRAAGRSYFVTSYFLFLITQPKYFRGAFLRHVFGDIRSSLWQDFKDRVEESDFDENDFEFNESQMTVRYKPTGNTIISKGFKKSAGNRSAKLKSLAGITHVACEEADENYEEDVNKLDDSIRTDKIDDIQIIFLYNPPSRNHWLIKRYYNLVDAEVFDRDGNPVPYYRAIPKENPNILCIHSTYRDNIKNLNRKSIEKYQAYGDPDSQFYNEEAWFVDINGLVSEGARGRIYRGFKHISLEFFRSLPYPSFYGLDFGYSEDPVALVEMKEHNGRLFWHQVIYETGLTNPALAKKMRALSVPKNALIFADNAEAKSIDELKDLGFYQIKPADKGPDSVLYGIKAIIACENYMTDTSTELWEENQEYKWQLDENGQPTNVPVDKNNHAKDAGRYGYTTYKKIRRRKKFTTASPSKEHNGSDDLLNAV